MKLRQMSVAFLINEKDEVLMLQKKSNSKFLSGLMVPIGGHMKREEIDNPYIACLREMEEETGLTTQNLSDLKLRYIVIRMKHCTEIRIQYVYFGRVLPDSQVVDSEEGQLLWIKSKDISSQNVTATTKEILDHYHNLSNAQDKVYVGSMKSLKGEPTITWALLEDWELPVRTDNVL
ncbi:NUDIX domain-containing protein [Aquibacillus kalidii]|uniref:NUDIX domain-containing protein n=1 Tax=Aquibacillus kalidii TaxID=2762597 RepID=UPI001644F3E2|nr:NUDIX domain-containing protein [Aquibacillus kalidii]